MTGLSFPQEVEVRVQRYHNDNGGLEKGRNLSVPLSLLVRASPLDVVIKGLATEPVWSKASGVPLTCAQIGVSCNHKGEATSHGAPLVGPGSTGVYRKARGELRHPLSTYHVQGSSHPWSHSGPTSTVMKSDGRQ